MLWLLLFLLPFSCSEKSTEIAPGSYKKVSEIPVPEGYTRDTPKSDSFSQYLRNLTLREDKTVYLYNGQKKENQDAQYAVLDIDVGKKDLQQCADAVIRLRAEYLYKRKLYNDIHFNFTSGQKAEFVKYAEGHRTVVMNNDVKWTKVAEADYSYKSFRNYLDVVYMYAGTLSLYNELLNAELNDIQPGDVFIQIGNPYGHAVIVMDVATNPKTGRRAFMLAQSYMPAQSIHILKNPEKNNDPWFYNNFSYELNTPEWTFKATDLKRFKE